MKADLELIITHDGQNWVARNDDLRASGKTLPELDQNLTEILHADKAYRGRKLTVFMGFDFNTIPTWIRQYAVHYFNRFVLIEA